MYILYVYSHAHYNNGKRAKCDEVAVVAIESWTLWSRWCYYCNTIEGAVVSSGGQ